MRRRELLALLGSAPALGAWQAPAPPVAIARCGSYQERELLPVMSRMFDQLGGLGRIVGNKTVTIKLNLTGSPGLRIQGRPLGVTHYTHPATVFALTRLLSQAGARRIRFVESCWGTGGPLEEYLLDSGWNVRALAALVPGVEFENTNALGKAKSYSRLKVPGGGHIYPAYDLNRAYEDTDVFVSMAKLKNHETCGVTLALKNCFGITPASIYGDDAGQEVPNESPEKGRGDTLHFGKRRPPKNAPQELDPSSSRDQGYRVPRIVVDLVAARRVDLSFVDGIETIAGGEGPWIRGVRLVKPGVLVAGTNPVTTDAVATAVMGYDPGARRGQPPFLHGDNTLALAEAARLGSADLTRIEVLGTPIAEARFPFDLSPS